VTRLRLVKPGRPPKPSVILQCNCGSREFIEAKTGVLFKDGKASGGVKQLLCAACLLKGERVVIA
jgi:hypothetical protein